ncbi:xylulose kinase-1 [Tanacetum coccineum]
MARGLWEQNGSTETRRMKEVLWIEAIRLFLAYASFKDFAVYQMDVKSAFLYGNIEEEVYIASTPMETSKALMKDENAEDVDVHLYRSMIGSLMYLTSSRHDIMFAICVCARFQVTPKVSHLHAVKRIFRYLKGQLNLSPWYPKDSPFDLEAYTDSDYAGASLDRKSTTGGCQFLGRRLISWQCKKQTIVANSTTKAEYVAASSCCGQSSGPIPLVVNETVYKEWDDRMERAGTTASSLEVEHDIQTRFETTSKKSNDPPLLRVNTVGSGEDSMKLKELMAFCTKQSKIERNWLNLLLPVQVNAVEGDFINTLIKGFNHSFDRFYTLLYSLIIKPNSMLSLIIKTITMSNLNFAETHNLVAFLEKPEESNGFEVIIDFLNASYIRYALTVNPTIYTSCIQQFWAFVKPKTVNDERQIQALVDKKKVVITEARIRSDLHLDDAEGIECLPNAVIFEQLTLMGEGKGFYRGVTPLFATMMVQAPQAEGEEHVADDTEEHVPLHSNDPPLSGEDSLKLHELMEICTNLQPKVLDLKTSKAAQAHEILSLKVRVKKLEKKKKSRPHELRRLYKIGSSRRVESSDEGLGTQEDASKQRRKIDDIDQDVEITLVDETQGRSEDMFDVNVDLQSDEVVADKEVDSTTDPITTAKEEVTTVSTTATITPEDVTLAQALVQIKTLKPKAKDKGKGIIVEDPLLMKKKDQIKFDKEVARELEAKLQAEMEEEERAARLKEEEANIALLKEKSKLFVELMEKKKKYFAELRAKEKINKPPTKAQKRNQMSTYLRHMGGFKHAHLKSKSYEEIQRLFDIEMKRVNSFIPMDSDVVEGSEKRAEQSSAKRAGAELEQEVSKKQKIDDAQDEEEMK